MFAFGSARWPGLAKLNEECGEVVQVIGKLMMTKGEVEHWDGGPDLKTRLEDEIGDVLAACRFVIKWCRPGLDVERINRRAAEKLALFERWHDEQQEK